MVDSFLYELDTLFVKSRWFVKKGVVKYRYRSVFWIGLSMCLNTEQISLIRLIC